MPTAVVPPKFVSETRTDSFDLSPYLVAGQTVSSVSKAVAVYSGVDAAPSGVISSAAAASPFVSAVATSGVAGVIYQIRLDAVLAAPAGVASVSYLLAVIPDAT